MSQAFLMLCHTPPRHLATLAQRHADAHYYVHYDAKSPISDMDFLRPFANVHVIPQRERVHWGGFSMIRATLHLLQAALNDDSAQYFHLISGDCVPLITPEHLTTQCTPFAPNTLWLEHGDTPRLRYRMRFHAPHADTAWQRRLLGKCLTKILKCADRILPSDAPCPSGSQWFSATRGALEILYHAADRKTCAHFAKRLCPDEHFFQYLATQHREKLNIIPNNQRFIRFQPASNHPDFLTLAELKNAQTQGFWFARKATPSVLNDFLTPSCP